MNTVEITIDARALKAARVFAHTDESRFSLCGVRIYVDGEAVTYVGTDGRRLVAIRTEHKNAAPEPVEPFTVRNDLIDEVRASGEVQLAIGAGRLGSPLRMVGIYDTHAKRSSRPFLRAMPEVGGTYAEDWRKVIPAGQLVPSSYAFNAELVGSLAEVFHAMAISKETRPYVRLWRAEADASPVVMVAELEGVLFEHIIVLMPVIGYTAEPHVPVWAQEGGAQ